MKDMKYLSLMFASCFLSLSAHSASIKKVVINGDNALSEIDYLNEIGLRQSNEMEEKDIFVYCDRVKAFLDRSGFHRSKCQASLEPMSGGVFALKLDITEGPAAEIDQINFTNEGYDLAENEAIKLQRLGAGHHKRDLLTPDRIRFYKERLREYLREERYYFAQLHEPIPEMNEKGNKVKLIWKINLGPQITVNVDSVPYFNRVNKFIVRHIWDEHETKILMERASYTEQPADFQETLQRGMEKLLQSKGFVDVQVNVTREDIDQRKVIYHIGAEQGSRVRLGNLTFEGVGGISKNELHEILIDNVKEIDNRWFWQSIWYDEAAIKKSLDLIIEIYRRRGFLLAAVNSMTVNMRTHKGTKFADVIISINEGQMTRLRRVRIEHGKKLAQKEIENLLGLVEGEPFNAVQLQANIERIKSNLQQIGYSKAEVLVGGEQDQATIDYTPDAKWADVVVRVREGALYYVRTVTIRGNFDTSSKVVMRELRLRPGDLYTSERHQKSINNLTLLGVFSSVSITPEFREDGYVDLTVDVRQLEPGLIEGGPGLGSEDGVRGYARISYGNLFSRANSISFRVDANRRLRDYHFPEYKLSAAFEQPYFLELLPIRTRYSATQRKKDTRTFDYQSREASVALSRPVFSWLSLGNSYDLIKVHQYNTILPEDDGTFRIGSITPRIFIDFRDDLFQTRKGIWLQLESEFANPAFGSQGNIAFIKPSQSLNVMISPFSSLSLRHSARVGYLISQRSDQIVPASKRYRLGGATTIRGFNEDEINFSETEGVDPETKQRINRLQKMMSINFRNEATIWLTDSLGWNFFWDLGNVYEGKSPDPRAAPKPNAGWLREGYGTGARLSTPIGPFNLDVGWRTNRQPGEDNWRLHFSLGLL